MSISVSIPLAPRVFLKEGLLRGRTIGIGVVAVIVLVLGTQKRIRRDWYRLRQRVFSHRLSHLARKRPRHNARMGVVRGIYGHGGSFLLVRRLTPIINMRGSPDWPAAAMDREAPTMAGASLKSCEPKGAYSQSEPIRMRKSPS